MPELIVGTAGHVDHGKSALIRALTGQETDRLPEERQRGISIDLGFASLLLPDGRRVGIIDVPGHERFIKNMVAGSTGVDVVLLVVAADEGVMPQTKEHIDILHLLGVQRGLVAITKVDLVDPEWLTLVEADLDTGLAGTFLAAAPRCHVSSVTGAGLDDLKEQLMAVLPRAMPRPEAAFTRLPVDRAFTVPGFGTVVTGTLVAGVIQVEDRLELLSAGRSVRVRRIHVYGQAVARARVGQRTALNLVGVSKDEVQRGDVLVTPGALRAVNDFAGLLSLLPDQPRPLANRARVHLHIGTAAVTGRVLLLDRHQMDPGQTAPFRFRAEKPMVAARGDAFIIRSYSPIRTIGGGRVLDAGSPFRRFRRRDLDYLAVLAEGDLTAITAARLQRDGGLSWRQDLAHALTVPVATLAGAVTSLAAAGQIVVLAADTLLVDADMFALMSAAVEQALDDHHRNRPLQKGMLREDLRTRVAGVLAAHNRVFAVDSRAFGFLLEHWAGQGLVTLTDEYAARPGFESSLPGALAGQAQDLLEIYRRAGRKPPDLAGAAGSIGVDAKQAAALLEYLAGHERLVRIDTGLYFEAETYNQMLKVIAARIEEGPGAAVADIRDALGTSRKYVVPLLEHLDRQQITRRQNDLRFLTGRGQRAAQQG